VVCEVIRGVGVRCGRSMNFAVVHDSIGLSIQFFITQSSSRVTECVLLFDLVWVEDSVLSRIHAER